MNGGIAALLTDLFGALCEFGSVNVENLFYQRHLDVLCSQIVSALALLLSFGFLNVDKIGDELSSCRKLFGTVVDDVNLCFFAVDYFGFCTFTTS